MREAQASKKLSERGLREPEEGTRVREVEVKGGKVRISQAREPREESPKAHPRLFIPLKCVTTPRPSEVLTPCLRAIPHTSVRLGIVSTKIPRSFPLTPTLRTLKRLPRDIRVRVHEPFKIVELKCPSPRLKLRPRVDRSIRPLLEPLTLFELGFHIPRLRPRHGLMKRLEVLPAPYVEGEELFVPKIGAFDLSRAKEPLAQGVQEVKQETLGWESEHVGEGELIEESLEPRIGASFSLPDCLLDAQYLPREYLEVGGLGNISSERLICILVDKAGDFHELVRLICAKLWRIKSRGSPKVLVKSCDEELSWRGLLEDVVELEDFEKMIEKLREERKENDEVRKAFINELKSRSVEGRLRFLLLPVKEDVFEEAYKLLSDPSLKVERYLKNSKFFAFKLKRLDQEDELIGRLLQAAFGFADVDLHALTSLGEYALELEGNFVRRLERVMREVEAKVSYSKVPSPGQESEFPEESWLHLALKYLVYSHLLFNEGVDEEAIKCEERVKGVEKVADVFYDDLERLIAVEIETMYGTGDPIIAKINPKTVLPYYKSKFKGELWLVIPNLHAFLFLRELLKLRGDYRREGLKLEIYVADVTGMGALQIYKEKRKPGLIKLIDVLKFIKRGQS